jgi:hypothetical protein
MYRTRAFFLLMLRRLPSQTQYKKKMTCRTNGETPALPSVLARKRGNADYSDEYAET